jgi:hypothetical protein
MWDEAQANRLDPIRESPSSIIDRKAEFAVQPVAWYGYRKPDPPFRFPKPVWRTK